MKQIEEYTDIVILPTIGKSYVHTDINNNYFASKRYLDVKNNNFNMYVLDDESDVVPGDWIYSYYPSTVNIIAKVLRLDIIGNHIEYIVDIRGKEFYWGKDDSSKIIGSSDKNIITKNIIVELNHLFMSVYFLSIKENKKKEEEKIKKEIDIKISNKNIDVESENNILKYSTTDVYYIIKDLINSSHYKQVEYLSKFKKDNNI